GRLLGRIAGPVAACFGLNLTLLGELRFAFPHQARLITRSSLGFQLAGTCLIGRRPSRHALSPAAHCRSVWRCLPDARLCWYLYLWLRLGLWLSHTPIAKLFQLRFAARCKIIQWLARLDRSTNAPGFDSDRLLAKPR